MSERHEVQVHRVGIPTGEPPKRIFRPESEVKAEALCEFADAIRTTEVLFRREDGSGVKVTDLLRERAAAIRAGEQ